MGEKERRGKFLASKLEGCGAGDGSKNTEVMGGEDSEGHGTGVLIWRGALGEQARGTLSHRRLCWPWGPLGRHVGRCPEDNALVGGRESCQPGRPRGQAGSIPLGKNGQCVCVLRLPFRIPSLPEAGCRPQGLLSSADLFPRVTDKTRVPASKVGFSLHLCWLGRASSLGGEPFP